MTHPLIGITTYGPNEKDRFNLPANYVDSVRRAGGAVVLLPPGGNFTELILSHLDGLIIAGGCDIDPLLYGVEIHDSMTKFDTDRDKTEIEIVHRVIDTGLPTLAICRGIQILNVALGGTLYPHLPDVVGNDVAHRESSDKHILHHIDIQSGSRVAEAVGQTSCIPASLHHQAVRDVGGSLEVVARAPDGIIEALELPGHPWLIALQWHPEMTAAEDATQQNVFDTLVGAAGDK